MAGNKEWKETEFGKVPIDWNIFKLKEKVDVIMGQSPSSNFYNKNKIGLPFMQGRTTFGDKYHTINMWTSEVKRIAIKDSVLMSVRAPVGDLNIAINELCIGRGLASLNMKNGNNEFLFYLLKAYRDQILNKETGTVFGSINKSGIENLELPFPPFLEQKKIAAILKSLDDKIELNNRMNETLEEMAQTIFKEWFVNFNFPNEEGKPYKDNGGKMVESALGMIPEGWKVETFGDVYNCYDSKRVPLSKNKRSERQGIYPYYGATSIMDYVDDYLFDDIYLMLGEDGSVVKEDGTPFVQYVWGKFWVNNHAHVLKGKNGISTEHLMIFSKQIDINPFITGAVQLKLNQKNMNSIPFIRALDKINKKFDEIIQSIFYQVRKNQEENQNLIKTRDILLPKLMNGEVRV